MIGAAVGARGRPKTLRESRGVLFFAFRAAADDDAAPFLKNALVYIIWKRPMAKI